MSKYLSLIFDAMGNIIIDTHYRADQIWSKFEYIEPSNQYDDAMAMRSDWERIGNDINHVKTQVVENHVA